VSRQALALQRMLAQRGHASELRVGVAKAGQDFSAHAWLVVGDRVLIGDEGARSYTTDDWKAQASVITFGAIFGRGSARARRPLRACLSRKDGSWLIGDVRPMGAAASWPACRPTGKWGLLLRRSLAAIFRFALVDERRAA